MVWQYHSPVPVGEEGGILLVLPALVALRERGGGSAQCGSALSPILQVLFKSSIEIRIRILVKSNWSRIRLANLKFHLFCHIQGFLILKINYSFCHIHGFFILKINNSFCHIQGFLILKINYSFFHILGFFILKNYYVHGFFVKKNHSVTSLGFSIFKKSFILSCPYRYSSSVGNLWCSCLLFNQKFSPCQPYFSAFSLTFLIIIFPFVTRAAWRLPG